MPNTIFQFFHWYYPIEKKLWKDVVTQAEHLAWCGISHVWLPPACKSSAGINGVGYDVYDLFDLGEFHQKGTRRTKYGTKTEYVSAIKKLHAAGLSVIADIVLNHKNGADESEKAPVVQVDFHDRNKVISEQFEKEVPTKYYFPARQKKYSEFVWDWKTFTGIDEHANGSGTAIFKLLNGYGDLWDDVVGDEFGNFDYLLGADIEFRNPHVRDELKYWGKWYVETTGVDGFRLDAVKHISPQFYKEWLDFLNETFGKKFFTVAEYWSPNLDHLHAYLDAMERRVQLFDVPLHRNFYHASKERKNFSLPDIFDGTLVRSRPDCAVTFVDNHDTQPTQALESFVEYWFKPHANALILLRYEGTPCVFYTDYYGGSYTVNETTIELAPVPHLYKMLRVRQHLLYGEQEDYFDHPNVIAWCVKGTEDNMQTGFVVVLSNSEDGFKEVNTGRHNTGQKFVDITGSFNEPVIPNEDGTAIFSVKERSISIWIKEAALEKIK